MARVRNAFKIRAADAPIIETSQFLQLYCPLLLEQLKRDDLFVPKLIVVRGSPGSGKSSLLRLFETDTLLAIHARRQPSDQDLVERLTDLGIIAESGPRAIGIYIQCDSSLRDMANLPDTQASLRLFNALLDTRILALFLRSLRKLNAAGCIDLPPDMMLEPLPPGEAPPLLFSQRRSLNELEAMCGRVEHDFGTLLNSFPDDPLPTSLQPHARVYSLAYLGLQVQQIPALAGLMPLVMLDDVQELYPDQRKNLRDELLRRVSIARWLAVRTHVFGLEELISMEGAEDGREYRDIPLDEIFQDRPSVFLKFAGNVVHRRLQHTDSLQQVTLADFKDLLRGPPDQVSADAARKAVEGMKKRVAVVRQESAFHSKLNSLAFADDALVDFEMLVALESELIGFERQANRGQVSLFPELDAPEVSNGKTAEAALLFLTQRLRSAYYWGFDTLATVASGNVEQFLSTTAVFVDRMIYRAELEKSDKSLAAREQEDSLKRTASDYYNAIEDKHRRGSAIRQFVDNLGLFFDEVTYRPNAPIAPGVNGFGLTRQELQSFAGVGIESREAKVFREVLTNAVAGNVFSVRLTKQGQAGNEKIIFYLNRVLCVKYRLPLNYGGWQHVPPLLLVKMMQMPVSLREMSRKGVAVVPELWDESRKKS